MQGGRPFPAAGNTIVDNDARGGEAGIAVRSTADTRIERNTANENEVGISVRSSNGALVAQNTANANTLDGIRVLDARTTLTANNADRNSELGINAVAGVVDGGKNRARANGNPLQCANIACH